MSEDAAVNRRLWVFSRAGPPSAGLEGLALGGPVKRQCSSRRDVLDAQSKSRQSQTRLWGVSSVHAQGGRLWSAQSSWRRIRNSLIYWQNLDKICIVWYNTPVVEDDGQRPENPAEG